MKRMEREKVIKSIEDCVFHKNDCVDCDYDGCVFKHGDCRRDLLADALTLLKEQDDKIRQLRLALKIMNGNGIRVDTEGW